MYGHGSWVSGARAKTDLRGVHLYQKKPNDLSSSHPPSLISDLVSLVSKNIFPKKSPFFLPCPYMTYLATAVSKSKEFQVSLQKVFSNWQRNRKRELLEN